MTGDKLKEFILRQGVTQAELSKRMGISSQSLSQSLSANDVKSGFLERVCQALGTTIWSAYGDNFGVSNINGNGAGINTVNNDPDMINRFLSIIEEKDRQISELISKLK